MRRWTRHSLVLIVVGLMYMGIGVAFILAPPIAAKDPSLHFALRYLTMNQWGVVFICTGALAGLAGFFPIGRKSWGYIVLTGVSAGWAAMYSMPVFISNAPPITLISSLLWAMLAFIWWAVSGLLSPEHVEEMIRRDRNPS